MSWILAFLLFIPHFIDAHCYFTPPPKWEIADPKMVSNRTIIGFLDKSKSGFCPSINLTTEKVSLSIEKYLEIVQKNCRAKKQRWRHLGQIQTMAGPAELTEIETKTKFGTARLLQAILLKEGTAYILTAGVLKKQFGKQAKCLETAMHSLTLCDDLFEEIPDQKSREALREAWQKKASGVDSKSFETMVLNEYSQLGAVWQILMLRQ